MSPATEGTERHARFSAFLRRLAETQAYALAGDPTARQVMGQYGLLRWVGHRPDDALTIAEIEVARANPQDAREPR